MKSIFTDVILVLTIVFLNACSNPPQTLVNKDSLASEMNCHALEGKLYFFAPEFDSTNLVATGECDCCSANIAFLDDSIFLNIDYCEDGCTYVKGKYQINDQELTLNYDSVTVEKIYPEPDGSGQTVADFAYNTIIHKADTRIYRKSEFKGRIIFANNNEFGAIDTGGSCFSMMESVRGQGIWDHLNTDPKFISQQTADPVNPKLIGRWSLPGERNASFQILEKTIYFLDQPKKYPYEIQNDSLKIKYDNYETAFLVTMKGSDTLIFEGDDRQVYYRSKN
jgi:hypothetical protein